MKAEKDINLAALVSETASQMIIDRKRMIGGQIKQLLQRAEGLAKNINSKKSELNKLESKLKIAQEKINKLKAGDWSVLEKSREEEKTNG